MPRQRLHRNGAGAYWQEIVSVKLRLEQAEEQIMLLLALPLLQGSRWVVEDRCRLLERHCPRQSGRSSRIRSWPRGGNPYRLRCCQSDQRLMDPMSLFRPSRHPSHHSLTDENDTPQCKQRMIRKTRFLLWKRRPNQPQQALHQWTNIMMSFLGTESHQRNHHLR